MLPLLQMPFIRFMDDDIEIQVADIKQLEDGKEDGQNRRKSNDTIDDTQSQDSEEIVFENKQANDDVTIEKLITVEGIHMESESSMDKVEGDRDATKQNEDGTQHEEEDAAYNDEYVNKN